MSRWRLIIADLGPFYSLHFGKPRTRRIGNSCKPMWPCNDFSHLTLATVLLCGLIWLLFKSMLVNLTSAAICAAFHRIYFPSSCMLFWPCTYPWTSTLSLLLLVQLRCRDDVHMFQRPPSLYTIYQIYGIFQRQVPRANVSTSVIFQQDVSSTFTSLVYFNVPLAPCRRPL